MMDPIKRDDVLTRAAKHHLTLVGYAFGFLRDWSAAEDVVQESYLVIERRWKDYKPESSIVPWARTIVRFQCLAYRNANKREYAFSNEYIEESLEAELAQHFDGASTAKMESQIQALSKCIRELNTKSQKLIHEFYVKGRMSKDIAKEQGRKEYSNLMHLWRLRTRLRKCMQNKARADEFYESAHDATPTHEEKVMDDFFTCGDIELEQVKNALEASKEGKFSYAQYVEEWCIFATALEKMVTAEQSETTEQFTKLSNKQDLLEIDRTETTSRISNKLSKASKRPSINYFYGGIAACLVLCLGMWYGIAHSGKTAVAIISEGQAAIKKANGESLIINGPDQPLTTGDSIEVADNAFCLINYIGEDTSIRISGKSKFSFPQTPLGTGKRVKITTGDLWFSVAKQENEKPFTIETEQADFKVLGTRFRLTVNPNKTILSVDTGRLLVKEKKSGQEALVGSGQQADVSIGNLQVEEAKRTSAFLANNSQNPEDGILLRYNFNEGKGRNIFDSSSFTNNIQMPDSLDPAHAWVKGPIGNAIYFGNGNELDTNRRLQIQNFSYTTVEDEFSILFWLYCSTSSVPRGAPQSIISGRDTKKEGFIISLGGQDPYKASVVIYDDNKRIDSLPTRHPFTKNTWYHVAFTIKKGLVQCYVNGQIDSSKKFAINNIPLPKAKPLSIGPFKPPFDLGIDEFVLSNRAVSLTEIQTYYSQANR